MFLALLMRMLMVMVMTTVVTDGVDGADNCDWSDSLVYAYDNVVGDGDDALANDEDYVVCVDSNVGMDVGT